MNGNKGEVRIEEPTRGQRTIARRAAESRATVPHLELSQDAQIGLAPGTWLLPHVVRAVASSLRELPKANSSYRDGHYELYSRINIGVTVPSADGYAIPTVFDADTKSSSELSAEITELGQRAQRGELLAPEFAGATFTVFEVGADSGAPLVVPPQAAALAVGAVREVPVIRDAAIVPGRIATLSLACDHRILYGLEAAGLLAAITAHLQEE